jgi:alpha-glucosidase
MNAWWREGVLYQIYPRSFADSNGDGVGDLRGVVSRLEYLEWLGVAGIWLNPVNPSPNADWGYDVADYLDVDPALGCLRDLDELIAAAGARGIRILLDLVPNHTSDRHPWFLDSRSSRDAGRREWYVWADPRPDGSPPNNWVSSFGGPAWTFDERTGQCYLHNFFPEQPDLNWWNADVRRAFVEILRFWFDRGVAGFRIDVANSLIKDRDLRDNPPVEPGNPWGRRLGQQPLYSMNRPEVHGVYRGWRELADGLDPPRVFVGEAWVYDIARWATFYGSRDDEFHLVFNFRLVTAPFEAESLRAVVEATELALPGSAWPAWAGSNHDIVRFPTRWCGDDPDGVRCVLMALLTLRGTPFLYYGDELGLPQTRIPDQYALDAAGRDGARTPMPWTQGPGAGFTAPEVVPWLPLGDSAMSVADQRDDPASTLSFCRDLIALRRRSDDLRTGAYASLPAPRGAWVWRRGQATVVAINLSERRLEVDGGEGHVLIGTTRRRDGERVRDALRLEPYEGVVVDSGAR